MDNLAQNTPAVKPFLLCLHCRRKVETLLSLSGPHFKADCSVCGRYVCFVSRKEIERLEKLAKSKSPMEWSWGKSSPKIASTYKASRAAILLPYKGK